MGPIVFAAPGIDRFHLHERLHRELHRRGFVAEALLLDPVAATFFRQQDLPCAHLAEAPAEPSRGEPLDELADAECARLGLPPAGWRRRLTHRRVRDHLARHLGGLWRWFDRAGPSLVLLHARRAADQALVQFVARQHGVRTLWTGDGLLPHTLQCDERGLDGDASAVGKSAFDYRDAAPAPELLRACLANVLGGTTPSALSRAEIQVSPWRARCADAAAALREGDLRGARAAFHAWREALRPDEPAAMPPPELPAAPFVAVLLQHPDDARLRLDASGAPAPAALVHATLAAARELDPALRTVAVLPAEGLPAHLLRHLPTGDRLLVVPAAAAAMAAATALATVTTNHPLGIVALLAGTPVVHVGRALYGLPGVSRQTRLPELATALRQALDDDQPTLRERFLSRLLLQGHLWCSAERPDHNGMLGLAQAVLARAGRPQSTDPLLRYRAGPAWPLAAER
jgi:hypothetical protein